MMNHNREAVVFKKWGAVLLWGFFFMGEELKIHVILKLRRILYFLYYKIHYNVIYYILYTVYYNCIHTIYYIWHTYNIHTIILFVL